MTDATAPDPIVEVHDLSRRFGRRLALDRVNLVVPRGAVLGLVGVNGSGKTTLLKHILGLYRAQSGRVRVFGRDPVADPVGVLSRVGHVSEECDLPSWMRVGELMRYTSAFYPDWDNALADRLRRDFGLDAGWRVAVLSRGHRARLALLLALAQRPDLLVLDEPSAGLDPLARRNILAAIVRSVGRDGRTVLFSSHLLDEVERIADHIALIDDGRVVFSGELETIRDRHRRLTLRFSEPRAAPPALAGVLSWEGEGHEWTAVCSGEIEALERAAAGAGAEVVDEAAVRLDELFAAHAGSARPGQEG
jgi:ABC-2 type transport system ATP-binding protein